MFEQFKYLDFTGVKEEVQEDYSGASSYYWLKKSNRLILKDIPRTFPYQYKLFEEIHSLSNCLIQVLGAFANFRPDVGYVQGMCYLASMLLIHLNRPEDCFVSFCNLVLSNDFGILFDFYTADQVQILKTYKVFWKLCKTYTPLIYKNLKDNDATCRMFLFEWVVTLFSNSFEISLCACLWDQILFFGQHQIMKIAISICQVLEKKYKKKLNGSNDDEFFDIQLVLKRAKSHFSKEELLTAIRNSKIQLVQI